METRSTGSPMCDGAPAALLPIDHEVVSASIVILRPAGELDMLTTPTLRARLDTEVSRGGHVVLDLAEVTFLSSTALHLLVDANQRAQTRGGTLHIAGVSGRALLRPFQITGLDTVLTLRPESADVVAAQLAEAPTSTAPPR